MKTCIKCGGFDWSPRGDCKSCKKDFDAARYLKHKETIKAKTAAWGKANPEGRRVRRAVFREENREKVRAYGIQWKKANRSNVRNHAQNRRALKANSLGKLSAGLTQKLFRLQKGKCPCCQITLGDSYHMDHNIPLARGGANADANMQLLCATCNLQKHARDPVDFMQSKGFLL